MWALEKPDVDVESLRPGERVVDVGCGAGLDSLIAARMVPPPWMFCLRSWRAKPEKYVCSVGHLPDDCAYVRT
jgi:hypothetical protein